MQEASPQIVGIGQSHAKTSTWVLRMTLDVSLDRMASVASVRAHLISRRCLSESSPFVTYLWLVDAEATSSSTLRTLSFSARQRFRCRNGLAPWYRRLCTHLAYLLDGLRVLMPAMVKNNPCPGVRDSRASAAACAVHGRMYKRLTENLVDDGNRSEPMTLHE